MLSNSSILIISIIAYLLGPLIYLFSVRRQTARALIDGFIIIGVSGLALLHFLELVSPENFFLMVVLLLLGLLGPNLFEKIFTNFSKQIHIGVLFLGITGFLIHVFLEAAVIAGDHHHSKLILGVILHRIPVGLTVWWLLRPRFGNALCWLVIVVLALANALGFFIGQDLEYSANYIQAFVTGSILHVLLFSIHIDETVPKKSFFEGLGSVLGIGFLIALTTFEHDSHNLHTGEFIEVVYHLFLLSSPALLLAYLLSGVVKALFTNSQINWINKGGKAKQALKGVVFGLPLPICSCGVLPLFQTLTQRGLAPAAAISFLIATPELGIDALLISLPLLGFELTTVRLIAAFILAFGVSLLLAPLIKTSRLKTLTEEDIPKKFSLKEGFQYSFGKLLNDTAPWIVIGILLAAFFEVSFGGINLSSGGSLDIILAGLLGIVLYICASGATPLAAVLIAAGVSPGAGLTFLLTGPATNISTFGVLANLHGRRFAYYFAATTFLLAVLLGFAVNLYFDDLILPVSSMGEHHQDSLLRVICFVVVIALYTRSLLIHGLRGFFAKLRV